MLLSMALQKLATILCFDGQQNTYQMSMGRLTHKLGRSSQNFDSLTLCWEKVFLYD